MLVSIWVIKSGLTANEFDDKLKPLSLDSCRAWLSPERNGSMCRLTLCLFRDF